MIIDEERLKNVDDKILATEVVLEKTPDGKESLKIIVKASTPGPEGGSCKSAYCPGSTSRSDR